MTSAARFARLEARRLARGVTSERVCPSCGTVHHGGLDPCSPECLQDLRASACLESLGLPRGTLAPWSLPSPRRTAELGWVVPAVWEGWGPQLSHARAVHGCVTRLLRTPHARLPTFAAWPCARGGAMGRWWLWTPDAEAARLLPEHAFRVQLGRDPRAMVRLGRAERLVPPPSRSAARYGVRIVTETPVVIRATQADGRALTRTAPEAAHIASTLTQVLAPRVGLGVLDPSVVPVWPVGHDSRPAVVDLSTPDRTMGGDGRIRGWTGEVRVETSGLGAWLLECAAALGLGGRTAFGFGRVRVEVVP